MNNMEQYAYEVAVKLPATKHEVGVKLAAMNNMEQYEDPS
jgi:hypothetical protein